VTCTNSGLTANSVPISVTMAPFINCYCNSVAASNSDEDILEVNLNGSTNTSNCLVPAIGSGSILNRYSNFTTLGNLSTLTLGSTIPFYIDVDDCDIPPVPYYSFGTSIWIDFNHNGSFNDIGEQVFVEPTSIIGPRIVNGNIAIPCSALLGQTKMRIVIAEGLAGSNISPCLSYNFGETEDYFVNLIAPTTCVSPVPSPGATLSTITILCDSSIATLSLTNKCLLSNYTFQWYKNSVVIPGATNNTYTTPKIFATTTYYCRVNFGSNFSNSTPITITKPNFNLNVSSSSSTYCTPAGTPVSISASGGLNYTYSPSSSLSSSTGSSVNATPLSNTTYTVIGTDANGCTRSSTVFIQVVPCGSSVNLKLYIQAYYIGSNLMAPALLNQGVGSSSTVSDSITVEFHNASSPYALVDTKKVLLNTNGSASVVFPSSAIPYYLAIKHRNALTTWSSIPIQASVGTYDFTTNNSKAYGNNMVNLATNKWAFYSGDILHDDNIDLLDLNLVEVGIEGYFSGYQVMDLNGDGNVDLLDTITLDPNIADFIYAEMP
jgi:GEVED domain